LKKIFESGADDYIIKPYLNDHVYTKLKKYLDFKYESVKKEETYDLDIEMSDKIPDNIKLSMKDALIDGDIDGISDLVNSIISLDKEFGEYIQELVNGFKFEELNQIF